MTKSEVSPSEWHTEIQRLRQISAINKMYETLPFNVEKRLVFVRLQIKRGRYDDDIHPHSLTPPNEVVQAVNDTDSRTQQQKEMGTLQAISDENSAHISAKQSKGLIFVQHLYQWG